MAVDMFLKIDGINGESIDAYAQGQRSRSWPGQWG